MTMNNQLCIRTGSYFFPIMRPFGRTRAEPAAENGRAQSVSPRTETPLRSYPYDDDDDGPEPNRGDSAPDFPKLGLKKRGKVKKCSDKNEQIPDFRGLASQGINRGPFMVSR
jgi:hypothetical protein